MEVIFIVVIFGLIGLTARAVSSLRYLQFKIFLNFLFIAVLWTKRDLVSDESIVSVVVFVNLLIYWKLRGASDKRG